MTAQTHVWRLVFGAVLLVGLVGCQADTSDDTTTPKPETTESVAAEEPTSTGAYAVVDTGQTTCYDDRDEIECPSAGEPFYGQDASFAGPQPRFEDNGDGTVSDLVTGLMWQQDPGAKKTFADAVAGAGEFALAGHDDWRMPTIKELYSLIDFGGVDPSGPEVDDASGLTPFIDTEYFAFSYGDASAGERTIDAQYWSGTEYVGTTMGGDATVFGVNFADGRIKGYPRDRGPGGTANTQFTLYVRDNPEYGENDFVDNGDGTVTDRATGLTWSQTDSGSGMDWESALSWVQERNAEGYLGYSDWRLPNAKELQSIVDYTRAPGVTNSAAIDPVFEATPITDEGGGTDYASYWTGTTHANLQGGANAAYVAFGEALGWFAPPGSGQGAELIDVHGAGAQRSDPKTGDAADWPQGNGPQGDVIRIENYVRLVRGGE